MATSHYSHPIHDRRPKKENDTKIKPDNDYDVNLEIVGYENDGTPIYGEYSEKKLTSS